MYSTEAKRVFIQLYEKATEKLASVYPTQKDTSKEGQPNGTTTTKR